jgi:hypothetical protein
VRKGGERRGRDDDEENGGDEELVGRGTTIGEEKKGSSSPCKASVFVSLSMIPSVCKVWNMKTRRIFM